MLVNIGVAIVALGLASYQDMKTREIPDILSFSLIGIGLILAILSSLTICSFQPIIASILGLIAAVIVGFMLYYTGQWGGGDTKILMGMGTIIGLDINVFLITIPNLIIFFINIFIIGALFGLIYVIYLAIRNKNKFKKSFELIRSSPSNLKTRKIYLILIPLLILAIVLSPFGILIKLVLILFLTIFYFIYQLSLVIKAVETSCMIIKIPLSKLTEGDWIVNEIKLKNNKKFVGEKTGISKEDISLLKRNNIKQVDVKYGMPFLPSFFVAYIMLLILGNWFLLI